MNDLLLEPIPQRMTVYEPEHLKEEENAISNYLVLVYRAVAERCQAIAME
jgi:hypothetical protein